MSPGHVKLKPQHAPKAPHQDPQFLDSTAARPLRILAEYLHPLVQLKNEGIGDTIVMFGSARIESHETAQGRLTRLKKTPASKLPAMTKPHYFSLMMFSVSLMAVAAMPSLTI